MKETPTVVSHFWGAFPSDHIPKMTKDVSVHFFIPRDELTVDNAQTVKKKKKNFQRYFSFIPVDLKFFASK
jgi:N-acetyl-anhydromuramyl-L-alanine amidase AmpD